MKCDNLCEFCDIYIKRVKHDYIWRMFYGWLYEVKHTFENTLSDATQNCKPWKKKMDNLKLYTSTWQLQ
jgi:hypothetical protein